MTNLEDLVLRAQNGEVDAYEQIVARFQESTIAFAFSQLGDFQLAEDVSQEAFISAFTDLPQLRAPEAFATWFRQVVRNRCGRHTRRKQLPLVSMEEDDMQSDAKGPDELLEEKYAGKLMRIAIWRLPEAERSVAALHFLGNFTQKRIAGILDLTEATVVNRIRSAKSKIKKEYLEIMKNNATQPAQEPTDFSVGVGKQLKSLEIMHGELCALLSELFGTVMERPTKVTVHEVDVMPYAEFVHPISNPCFVILSELHPAKCHVTLDIPMAIVFALLRQGKTGAEAPEPWTVTEDETLTLFPIVKKAIRKMDDSWASTLEVEFRPTSLETKPSVLLEYPDYPTWPEMKEYEVPLPKPGDRVYRVAMTVDWGESSADLAICYPLEALESIL